MERRNFVKTLSLGSAAIGLTLNIKAENTPANLGKKVRFGICTDVHKDIMHDADLRLQAFIDDASVKKPDFIIQMGDFCRPYDYNKEFLNIWNSFEGKKFHVLGNHDMDGGFTREQTIDFWNSEAKYYSFNIKGIHFVVLDGNDADPSPNHPEGYARFFGKNQLEWLENDLDQTNLPTVIFSHQGLDNDLGGIFNATKSRLVLERANQKAGFQKVLYAFSGHHHQDYHNTINGIHYIQINSMSYQWLGDDYKQIRYSKEIDEKYPWIKYTVPYKDPLWAMVEISSNGNLQLHGKSTEFVGPGPEELGIDKYDYGYAIVPFISDRKVDIK